jgi:hypothetical protein
VDIIQFCVFFSQPKKRNKKVDHEIWQKTTAKKNIAVDTRKIGLSRIRSSDMIEFAESFLGSEFSHNIPGRTYLTPG